MEFLALVVLFWVPPIIILFKNTLWNLYLWQQKQYRFERFTNYIQWDHQPQNRELLLYNLKFVVFSLVCTIVVSAYSSAIGVLIAYTIWSLELFMILDNIFKGKHNTIKDSVRNLSILLILSITVAVAIALITNPFINPSSSSISETHLLPDFVNSNHNVYDIYVYLSLSAILALFLDLASPLLVALAVLATSPIGWTKSQIAVYKLKEKISQYRNNLTVIAITGSIGKTVTKEMIIRIIKDRYNILKTSDVYTTIEELSNDITNQINKNIEMLIIEVEPFKKGELLQIGKILNPDITIITDVDIQHYGIFKNKQEYVEARLELVNTTNPNGAVITTIDNKYILHTLNQFKGQKIGFSFLNKKASKLNELNYVEIYKRSINGYKFMIKNKDELTEYQSPLHRISLIHQLIPAILTAKQLGIEEKYLKEKVNKLNDKFTNIFTTEGDNKSILVSTGNIDSNLKGVLALVDYANNIKRKFNYSRIILVSDGVSELGRIKRKSYARLVEKIKHKVSIVVTTDSLLYDLLAHSYLDILNLKARDTSESLFIIRTILKEGDIVIVEGKDSQEILQSLRSQE